MKKSNWDKFMKQMNYKEIKGIKDADIEIYDGEVGYYLYFRRRREDE